MASPRPELLLYESIFKHATMGILVVNTMGEIVLVNQFCTDEFGYKRDELIGEALEKLIPEKNRIEHIQHRKTFQAHAETRAMGAGRDLYGQRKDGSAFPVEISLSPFQSGANHFVIAFIVDISVRKEKEATEKEYRKKINEILASLRKEKELNELKSKFVSLASHEFKTPLSTILSSASLLSKYTSSEDQPSRDKHIERIKSAVLNLNGMLNEFLSIGKIENGKIGVHYLDFDLSNFLRSLCGETEDLLKPGQHIDYRHSGKTNVSFDIELLRNIMSNLLANAIKFSGDNGIIQVESRCTAHEIVIKVKDNGLGIAPEDQLHLFDRFYRGNNVLNIPGTGLGLHIVSKYVELMRGTIQISSELNKGTEIILNFKQ